MTNYQEKIKIKFLGGQSLIIERIMFSKKTFTKSKELFAVVIVPTNVKMEQ